jgi:hypothetical protein
MKFTVVYVQLFLLGAWDRNGLTSGPTPWLLHDDDDDDDVQLFKSVILVLVSLYLKLFTHSFRLKYVMLQDVKECLTH